MWQRISRTAIAAVWVLTLAVGAHSQDNDLADVGKADSQSAASAEPTDDALLSYFAYGKYPGPIVAHTALMVLAWCFVLPAAVMLSVARSKLTLLSQFSFLLLNALGMAFGVIYNKKTPDLYENNAHHKIGWAVTWVACAKVIMSLISSYAGTRTPEETSYESVTFLSIPANSSFDPCPWQGDSGQGTERNSESLDSRPQSFTCESSVGNYEDLGKPEDQEFRACDGTSWWQSTVIDRIDRLMHSPRLLSVFDVLCSLIDRIVLILGFIAIATGGITYSGILRGEEVFNGLAHFIKGGIFFWYGLLTLGRWMGCWADFGWAWNVKPSIDTVSRWKTKVPTGEFVESFVIFAYGASNVFLEHLAGWGKKWSATDLEHVSISIMFFGGGLCGMLLESDCIRRWLNSTILPHPNRSGGDRSTDVVWKPPDTQRMSLNPMPALVIFLLGAVMGSHHQDNVTSTIVHRQWGNLFFGFAVARGATYILLYIRPPTSYLPARPPTEIAASFCLISGGLIFIMSTRDVIDAMIYYEIDTMLSFTVAMGLTAFIMAYEIFITSIKAWAIMRQMPFPPAAFRLSV